MIGVYNTGSNLTPQQVYVAQAMSSLIGISWSWAEAPFSDCKDCTFLISEYPCQDAVHSVLIAFPSPLNFPGLLGDQVKKGLAQFVLDSKAGFPSSLFVAMAFSALPISFLQVPTSALCHQSLLNPTPTILQDKGALCGSTLCSGLWGAPPADTRDSAKG